MPCSAGDKAESHMEPLTSLMFFLRWMICFTSKMFVLLRITCTILDEQWRPDSWAYWHADYQFVSR